MTRRSYDQYCTLARALDIVGERWTLLIVRELFLGPRRFTDLLPGLPGIGKNLLAARLRHLEAEGLVRRKTLPAPAGSRVYELTEDGRALGPAMAELSRWGMRRLGDPRPGDTFRPDWAVFPFSYAADREAARGVRETYEFRVDGEAFHLLVDDGEVEPRAGGASDPDLTAALDGRTLLELLSGSLTAFDAISSGRVTIDGSPEALGHCVAILAGPGGSDGTEVSPAA